MAKADLKRRWEPSEAAFHRLLGWLDQGAESHGERYLEIRERLVHYFARRGAPAPDDLADETLNRVARRLEEAGSIDDIVPAQYCYVVGRFVLLESLRRNAGQPGMALGDRHDAEAVPAPLPDDAVRERERTLACLERCLEACTPSERALILDYYTADSRSASGQRKHLAGRLGFSPNALAIRACRIRNRLERCVRICRDT